MDRSCAACGSPFEIVADDLAFLDKLSPVFSGKKESLPPPTLCPRCRQQRRLAFRNESNLYRRKCDATGEVIVSLLSEDKPFKVYRDDAWWKDDWDPLDYGQEIDWDKPFFSQLRELQLRVPRRAMSRFGENENADYVAYGGGLKNCYFSFSCQACQDVSYSTTAVMSKDCLDCLFCVQGELLYECIDCKNCYGCAYCKDVVNCHDSYFLDNCKGCRNCIACKNLRDKEYHIYNKPVTPDEFEAFRQKLVQGDWMPEKDRFDVWKLGLPYPAVHHMQSEHSSGDYLERANHCRNCFDIHLEAEDCAHCQYCGWKAKDMMDCTVTGVGSQLLYECFSCGPLFQGIGNIHASGNNLYYCDSPQECSDCFGCIGLRRQKYCILNKQYTKEEYEELIPKIIEHMRRTKEWGEYFPISMSPFAYNESMAHDYFPLSKEEAVSRSYEWKDEQPETHTVLRTVAATDLPTSIAEVSDEVCDWAITCAETGKPFRIVQQELSFYRNMGLPLPHIHPSVRQKRRKRQRNPYQLWSRTCAKCSKDIETSYAPDRPEIVYCEECYFSTVY